MRDSEIFIVGANGQLGTALRNLYPGALSADINELDITNKQSVISYDWSQIKLILNAAAYTNVDGAEIPEGRVASWKVNASAVGYLSEVASANDITLIHISSDYVFDGTKTPHTEDEAFAPLGVYGQTKAAGDIAASLTPKHYLIRTSWVIGEGNNFVKTMKSLADKGIKPAVVNDQIGRLTFTSTLADGIKHLIDTRPPYGTYNFTNEGESVSWADIAKDVFTQAGASADDVTGVSTDEYYAGKVNISPRPLQSTLDLSKIKTIGFEPTDWKVELDNYMQQLKDINES